MADWGETVQFKQNQIVKAQFPTLLTLEASRGCAPDFQTENGKEVTKKPVSRFSDFAKPAHKAMSRALGYCLTLGTPDAWRSFQFIASQRLRPSERGALAAAVLSTLSDAMAEYLVAEVIGSAGSPLPAFLGGMGDARHWASLATRSELKAYALAAYEALPPKDRKAFASHIGSMRDAA